VSDSLWTFAFEIANFGMLAAVLAWLFFKPVRQAIENQRAKVRRHEEDAAQALADAERLRKDIESQRATLATELEAIRAKARDAAKQEAESIINDARAHMEKEHAALKRDALHIERAQAAKIASAVATATHETMKRFLEQMQGPELEQTLIKAACRELQAFSNNALKPVTIEVAKPLDDESRQLIMSSLGTAAKTADLRVDPELKGGVRIATAHGLIDASFTGLAKYAQQSLSAEMESMLREESESE
jgi:F0F1-type ATP synthase membrane subunit b/b'